MGIKGLLMLVALQQSLQALAAIASKAGPHDASEFRRDMWPVVSQWATNGATLAGWGIVAVNSEFGPVQAVTQAELTAEANLATQLPSLPPIT